MPIVTVEDRMALAAALRQPHLQSFEPSAIARALHQGVGGTCESRTMNFARTNLGYTDDGPALPLKAPWPR